MVYLSNGRCLANSTQAARCRPPLKPSQAGCHFHVTFGADLAKLVREDNQRNVFPKMLVVSLLSGEPAYLDML
jgi:hypothetical protein